MMKRFQVIQGGKSKDKGPVDEAPRLFRACSIGDFSKGDMVYTEVKFNWYCLERSSTHIQYSTAIADYENLNDRDRKSLERTADRYFTDFEIQMLREYLASSFGLELQAEQVTLPIHEKGVLFEEGSSVIYDFLELSERKGYDLPFKVWGYYTLAHSLSAPSLDSGLQLLKKVFQILGFSPSATDDQLRRALSRVYREDGLFVRNRERSRQN